MQPYHQQSSDASTGYPSHYQNHFEEQAYPVFWGHRDFEVDFVFPVTSPFYYGYQQPYYPVYLPYPYSYYYQPYPYTFSYYDSYAPVASQADESHAV
ncbi:hypothetical protein NDK47_05780 [Brevibacillus ruminantium]|uniref:Spore coat protein n=1 Tax=Brevibacillus ruminantium TaxID=2950604 RepID=A0ABY4WI32_9BACL|nr:hypothetical protein [Brevibacillus ruminantium]USG66808.1 hypothetical protein NDK47_05780 [Brevibacillus ruminantium]